MHFLSSRYLDPVTRLLETDHKFTTIQTIIMSGGQAIQLPSLWLVIQPFTEIYTALFFKGCLYGKN